MDDFEKAYRFLYEYKQCNEAERLCLTDEEFGMLMLLAKEFLLSTDVTKSESTEKLSNLIQRIFFEDSKWNRALCSALDTFYCQIGMGQEIEGILTLKTFIDSCPAKWYRSHAETELENLAH